MPPNLGQGGGMALEDSVIFGIAFIDTDDVASALDRYDRER
jgi:2-polyprenyl-6-methoxyphenol hydroxylase-like FAD-dependent oxidoreductase